MKESKHVLQVGSARIDMKAYVCADICKCINYAFTYAELHTYVSTHVSKQKQCSKGKSCGNNKELHMHLMDTNAEQ